MWWPPIDLRYRRALTPNGICVIVGGSTPAILQSLILNPLLSMTGDRKTSVLMYKPKTDDLVFMNDLFEAGKVVPVIDGRYPLSEVAEALRRFGEGDVIGKIVITT